MKVRERSILKEAFCWTGGPDQQEDPEWAIEAIREGFITFESEGSPEVRLIIHSNFGVCVALPGDWIIQDGTGDIYPLGPAAFHKRFEEVAE